MHICRLAVPILCPVVLVLAVAYASCAGADEVLLREEPLVLPTYAIGPADPNPRFAETRAYQGAKGPVYPYPMLDVLGHEKVDRTYTALWLENEYVRFCVLPEIGGRIFEAYDKTNDRHFFYRQHVIKPDLIGMLGAWISGGVEWCVFHHHRNTTFMPVDYRLVANPDGSKTIWIGETERRHRMKWIIGMTLHPGRSNLDVTVKLFNRTPYPHTMLYWANVAVHATDGYQIIFPPSTQYATFHGKHEFTRWPISSEVFNHMDYTRGVDVSWWKNHPQATSFFAWDVKEDFFAGYDHDKRAGVVHVADHHVVPGMKLWTWGTNSTGDREKLTDSDGPYAEIMVGAYSDNQPDYSWIQPHEVKVFQQCWYPLRETGGVLNATREAAVNLTVNEGHVTLAFNTTRAHTKARVRLSAGEKSLIDETVAIDPAHPYSKEIALPEGVNKDELRATLEDENGRELVAYRPRTYDPEPMPEPVNPPPEPEKIETVEELYLTGLRLQQFYNPVLEPYPYFEEALKRDPGESRVLTVLAVDDCRRGLFERAEERLRKALARITKDYTRPKDGEPYYFLGVALAGQGKYDEAYDAYNRAMWSWAWRAPALYALAELDCRRGDFETALEHLDGAVAANALDTRALDLRACVLRHLGRSEDAKAQAAAALAIDPLDFWAMNEVRLAGGADESAKHMRGEVQSYLELATDYANAGLDRDAMDVLARLDIESNPNGSRYPMLYYYLAWLSEKAGAADMGTQYRRRAAEMPSAFCFPFRLESLPVLRRAIELNPEDVRAHHYLGNLLYDLQPEAAVEAWERAAALDTAFAPTHRNLGFAYGRRNDLEKAIAAYGKAIEYERNDARLLYELDVTYERAGAPLEKRQAVLARFDDAVEKRDDILSRAIMLHVAVGDYDRAIAMLERHHFHVWEGAGDIHQVYVDAHLLRGHKRLEAGLHAEAEADFRASLEYPENLGVDRPLQDPNVARAMYLVGKTQQAAGKTEEAKASFAAATEQAVQEPVYRYYQGLAYRDLGDTAKSREIFDALVAEGQKRLDEGTAVDFFAKFGERESQSAYVARAHYIMGLGHAGNGDAQQARAHFTEALKANPNDLWARLQLAELE
jgi:tetratricopeptide (TPR) repeat protein